MPRPGSIAILQDQNDSHLASIRSEVKGKINGFRICVRASNLNSLEVCLYSYTKSKNYFGILDRLYQALKGRKN